MEICRFSLKPERFTRPHGSSGDVTEDAAEIPGSEPCNWAMPCRFALLLAAMIAIPFWDILLGFKTFVIRDYGLYSYPVASYLRRIFLAWRPAALSPLRAGFAFWRS